jgi:hypothetical protein
LEAEAGVKPRSPKGRAQRAGLTPASASNTLSCQWETLHPKLLRSIKNPIGDLEYLPPRIDATKMPPNDSALFPLRFTGVHGAADLDQQ